MNKHGLTRDIPSDVRRQVRQRDGFGCVVCGSAIYQYEHLDPEFADATQHDPAGIILLCGSCHDRKTRGQLSKETIAFAAANPKALQTGYSFGPFDVGNTHPDVVLGPLTAVRTSVIVQAFDTPLIRVDPPEMPNGPFRLSALLYDSSEQELLKIVENEWRTPIANWDAEIVGARIILRRAAKDVTLRMRMEPPRAIVIEKLRMYYRGALIECVEGGDFKVTSPDGSVFTTEVKVAAVECEIGVTVRSDGLGVGYKCKGGLQFRT